MRAFVAGLILVCTVSVFARPAAAQYYNYYRNQGDDSDYYDDDVGYDHHDYYHDHDDYDRYGNYDYDDRRNGFDYYYEDYYDNWYDRYGRYDRYGWADRYGYPYYGPYVRTWPSYYRSYGYTPYRSYSYYTDDWTGLFDRLF